MQQKKYHSIVRLGHRSTVDVLKEGDHIVVQEKIDGANASFRKDKDGTLRAFSRNQELNEGNTLGGFYQWVQENIDPNSISEGVIYFGEWINPHKIKYPNYQKHFFLYDVYIDGDLTGYVNFDYVKACAEALELNLIPTFYEGKYKSFEHLESFIGQTKLGGQFGDKEMGEGIVVKNVDYKDRFGKQMFVKLVSDEFAEVQQQKKAKDPNRAKSGEMIFVELTVVEPRVEKLLHKFVDEGFLHSNFGIEDMGLILRHMGNAIFDDIMAEEFDMLPVPFDEKAVRKSIGKRLPVIVKNIINKNSK